MIPEGRDYAGAVSAYIARSRRRASDAAGRVTSGDALARELEEAFEELAVSAEELRVQNEALQAAMHTTEVERHRYQELFDAAPDAYIVTDENGVIREANRAASMLFQVPPAMLIGKPIVLYLPAEERRVFRSRLLALSRLEQIRDWDVTVERRDGSQVPVAITAVGLADAQTETTEIRWLLRDLTERRRAEEARRQLHWEQSARMASEQAEKRAQFLANASRTFAAAKTADDILHTTAALAAPFLGSFCLVDRLIGRDIVRVAARHADDAHRETFALLAEHHVHDEPDDPVARVIRSGTAEVITRPEREPRRARDAFEDVLDALGTRVRMVVPLRGQEGVLGALTIGRTEPPSSDMSAFAVAKSYAERAALALEHQLLVRALEASRQQALDANRAKADFLAVLSHEIRTPLTAALGYTELLMDGVPDPLPERATAFIRGIQASIHHQIAIMDDLLLFARVEAGVEEVRRADVDVGAVVQEVTLLLQKDAEAVGIPLIPDLPGTAILLFTDRAKLRQILLNLTTNALRHTERGEIRLRVRAAGEVVRIDVADTGAGIAATDLERVFERFWRGEVMAGRKRGIGLGLTISRHLVELMGGGLSVSSAAGTGSVFTVTLPLSARPADPNPSPESRFDVPDSAC